MVAIIDYDAGNIRSVEKALQFLGEETCITRDRHMIRKADRVILPGVGAFGEAMKKLRSYDLVAAIQDVTDSGTPFLGICLGLKSLQFPQPGRLFQGIEEGAYVYFVQSYYLQAQQEEIVKATTQYGVRVHAAVEKGNVFACQFHPEKSSEVGLTILKNFMAV